MADAVATKSPKLVPLVPPKDEAFQSPELVAFNKLFEWAGTQVFERDDELMCIKLALLTKEHALFHGIHGVSKSDLAFSILYNIRCKSFFEAQLTQFDGLEVLFGPVDIECLKKEGYYKHNTTDCLPEAELAVLEEIMDANGPVLRSTLQTLNERKFTRGRFKKLNCPLWTVVGTTNFLSEDKEKIAAVTDRFLLRSTVSCMEEKVNRHKMYQLVRNGHAELPEEKRLDFAIVKKLAAQASAVTISNAVLDAYDDLLHSMNAALSKTPEVPYITDRRARRVLKLIKAFALLGGRKTASYQDVADGARYGFCVLHRVKDEDEFSKASDTTLKVHIAKSELNTKYEQTHALVVSKLEKAKNENITVEEKVVLFVDLRKIIRGIESHFVSQAGSAYPDIETNFKTDLEAVKAVFNEISNSLNPEQIKKVMEKKGES